MIVVGGLRRDADWMIVHADQEYVLNINLSRINGSKVSLHPLLKFIPATNDILVSTCFKRSSISDL